VFKNRKRSKKRIGSLPRRSLQRTEALRLDQLLLGIEELRLLSPRDFENVIARMFELMGFAVKQTPLTNDGGRDAILTKDGKTFLLECKKYNDGNVSGRPDLQKFHSAIMTDDAVSGFFVTAGGFSQEAVAFSKTVPIDLVDQYDLKRMMFESSPDAINDDTYRSMCRDCGEIVNHRLRTPRYVRCCNGHRVAPTLSIELVVAAAASPRIGSREHRKTQWRKRAAMRVLSELSGPSAEKSEEAVRPGDRITLRHLDDNNAATYTLSDTRSDPAGGMLSLTSPLGSQLVGLVEGDETEFEVDGRVRPVLPARVERLRRSEDAENCQKDRAVGVNAIQSTPKDAVAFLDRGVMYANNGQYDRAIADYDEAIRLDPQNVPALSNRGDSYLNNRQYDRAIADYDEVITLNPKDADAWHNRGLAYARNGQHDCAITDYGTAIRLNPEYADAFYDRGSAHAQMGDYDDAIADYAEAIRLDPKNTECFVSRDLAYRAKGQYDRAIADYDEAIRLDPTKGLYFWRRGMMRADKGQYDRAIAHYDQGIRIHPGYTPCFAWRGRAYLAKGQHDSAIADFDEAIRLSPNFTLAIELRAEAIARKNELGERASTETLSVATETLWDLWDAAG
jgi:tetratricopeptide (TPR) repeat protein/transcription elongation GreA/GreB family factor